MKKPSDPTNRILDASLGSAGTLETRAESTTDRALRLRLLEGSCDLLDASLRRHERIERHENRVSR